jgi:hypothetical protein
LEKKLSELEEKPADSQTAEEQHASGETAEPVEQNETEDDTEVTVVEYQPEQTEEAVQSAKEDDKRDLVF